MKWLKDILFFAVFAIVVIPFGIPVWLLADVVRSVVKIPFIVICNGLIAIEFFCAGLVLGAEPSTSIAVGAAAGLFCTLPPLLLARREDWAEGYNGEYVQMGHIICVFVGLLVILRFAHPR